MLLKCLEKILEHPLDCKAIQRVNPEGSQSWIFIGRTDAEAETPILWPPDVKNWLTGKDWCWEILKAGVEGVTEDEMVGWRHWLDGHEYEQDLWDGEGQGSLACCSAWGCKQLNTTEWPNNNYDHQHDFLVPGLWNNFSQLTQLMREQSQIWTQCVSQGPALNITMLPLPKHNYLWIFHCFS